MNRLLQLIVLLSLAVLSGCNQPVVDLPANALGNKQQMDTYLGKIVRVTGKPVLDKVGDCVDAGNEYFVIRDCSNFPHGSSQVTVVGTLTHNEWSGWSAYTLENARVER